MSCHARLEAYNMCLSEHSGTHMDAPNHFSEHGWSTTDIPVEHLIANGKYFL